MYANYVDQRTHIYHFFKGDKFCTTMKNASLEWLVMIMRYDTVAVRSEAPHN